MLYMFSVILSLQRYIPLYHIQTTLMDLVQSVGTQLKFDNKTRNMTFYQILSCNWYIKVNCDKKNISKHSEWHSTWHSTKIHHGITQKFINMALHKNSSAWHYTKKIINMTLHKTKSLIWHYTKKSSIWHYTKYHQPDITQKFINMTLHKKSTWHHAKIQHEWHHAKIRHDITHKNVTWHYTKCNMTKT